MFRQATCERALLSLVSVGADHSGWAGVDLVGPEPTGLASGCS